FAPERGRHAASSAVAKHRRASPPVPPAPNNAGRNRVFRFFGLVPMDPSRRRLAKRHLFASTATFAGGFRYRASRVESATIRGMILHEPVQLVLATLPCRLQDRPAFPSTIRSGNPTYFRMWLSFFEPAPSRLAWPAAVPGVSEQLPDCIPSDRPRIPVWV